MGVSIFDYDNDGDLDAYILNHAVHTNESFGPANIRNNRVYVVDAGSYTSRSGPRLVTGLEIMAEMIHPELFSGLIPEAAALRLHGDLTKV